MRLPEDLARLILSFVPPHHCATLIADFFKRIGYSGHKKGISEEDEDISFCLADYRAEPDFFDCRHDARRGCVRAFYDWGDERDDPRLHGGRR